MTVTARETRRPYEFDDSGERNHPATQMQLMLANSRKHEADFGEAWSAAWARIAWPHDTEHRLEWKDTLRLMKPLWRQCYERQPIRRRSITAAAYFTPGEQWRHHTS